MAQTPDRRSRRWTLRIVVLAIALALLNVFIAQNFVVVEVRLLTQHLEMRLAWAMLITGLLGIVIGLALPRIWR